MGLMREAALLKRPMIQDQAGVVRSAIRTIENERSGLEALQQAMRQASGDGLGAGFSLAVERIAAAPGRVIVTGMGKSGHVGRKLAATLASTGQPASFVHPAEASHGDLGMVQNGDVVLAISWSGETAELAAIVTFAKRYAIPLIAMTAQRESALGRHAWREAAPRPRSDAYGGKDSPHRGQRAHERGHRRNVDQGLRLRRGLRGRRQARRDRHRRRLAPAPESRFLARYASLGGDDAAAAHHRPRGARGRGSRTYQP